MKKIHNSAEKIKENQNKKSQDNRCNNRDMIRRVRW